MIVKKINSITLNSSYNYVLKKSDLDLYERALLGLVLKNAPLKNGEHDLYITQNYSNAELARIVGCSRERVRQAKESLHARNIFLIDNRTWEQYNLPSGKRFKPQCTQDIQITQKFISYLIGEISNWIFNFCKTFFEKLTKRKSAKFSGIKKGDLWKEEDWVPKEKTTPSSNIDDQIVAREMRNNIFKKLFGRCDVIIKPWTSSVSSLVRSLLASGTSIVEVARLLKQQNYVSDLESGVVLVKKTLSG